VTPPSARRRILQLVAFVAAVPVALVALWFVTAQYEEWRYIRPWERVARGDSEDRVLTLLGHPHRILTQRSDKGSWQAEGKVEFYDADIAKSFRYVPFSITAEEYEVSFDPSGHVVSKYHFTSQ
jgi:hypothetical protein